MKNLYDILRNLPLKKRMYSPMCGDCAVDGIGYSYEESDKECVVTVNDRHGNSLKFNQYGQPQWYNDAECLLFPDRQCTWEKWQEHMFEVGDYVVLKGAEEFDYRSGCKITKSLGKIFKGDNCGVEVTGNKSEYRLMSSEEIINYNIRLDEKKQCGEKEKKTTKGDLLLRTVNELAQREHRYMVKYTGMDMADWITDKVEFSKITPFGDKNTVDVTFTILMLDKTYNEVLDTWSTFDKNDIIIQPLDSQGKILYLFVLRNGEVDSIKFSPLGYDKEGKLLSYQVRVNNLTLS